ncbi:nucleoid occlusion protein [Bianquea renquensis]|jgi:ParB-like protein|uniref:Nucleoid occlusion protein n=1 Tax=Bianquea renquensis TaxID=2763661 RepID=A0A926I2F3_9FIRM|nr:nucleoid occlusion protein [Bianquea renquensis]MBC8544265.1 nucleoid occlusion protein [Bianquea renquensis]
MNSFDQSKYETLSVISVEISKIRPNPYQPRRSFDNLALGELAQSIKEHGVMQPISVRTLGDGYELIAGERRLRASQLAGLTMIPAIVVDITDQESAVLALIENIQRQDLNYFEEAQGYLNLIEDYDLRQEQIAKMMGKSQSTIANKLRLLKLSPQIQKDLMENGLTERHARVLLKLPDEALQRKVLHQVIEENLTVKHTEELVEAVLDRILKKEQKKEEEADSETAGKQKIKRYIKDIRLFTNTVQKAVTYMKDAGVPVEVDEEKNGDYYEMIIRVPYK